MNSHPCSVASRAMLAPFLVCLAAFAAFQPQGLCRADTGLPDILYVNLNGTVIRRNLDAPTSIYSTPSGTFGFADIARTVSGKYLVYRLGHFGAPPALFEVNPDTGQSALSVASLTAAPDVASLTSLPDGQLLGYDGTLPSPRLVRIDPVTLNYQPVATTFNFIIGGLATAANGTIYAWGSGSSGGGIYSKLFTLNLANGSAQEIGGFSGYASSDSFADMAFTHDGRLIGLTEINGGSNGGPLLPNSVYELDLDTGIPQLLAQNLPFLGSIRGFEFIPEPSSVILAGSLVMLLGCIRKRRSSWPSLPR